MLVSTAAHGLYWVCFFHLVGKLVDLGIGWRIVLESILPVILFTSWYAAVRHQIRGPFVFSVLDMFAINSTKFLLCAAIAEFTIEKFAKRGHK